MVTAKQMRDRGPAHEFECADCGTHILSFIPPVLDGKGVCGECAWLRSIADPELRERMRKFLRERGDL